MGSCHGDREETCKALYYTILPSIARLVASYRDSFSTSIDVHITSSYSAHRILVRDRSVSSCCNHRIDIRFYRRLCANYKEPAGVKFPCAGAAVPAGGAPPARMHIQDAYTTFCSEIISTCPWVWSRSDSSLSRLLTSNIIHSSNVGHNFRSIKLS
jgi:hypothetical protein